MQTRFAPLILCAAVTFSLFSGGCWSYRPTTRPVAVARAAGPDLSTWPTREVEPLKPLLENTPAVIEYWSVKSGVDPASLTSQEKQLLESGRDTVVYKGIHGRSLLRIFDLEPKSRISQAKSALGRFLDEIGPGFPSNARTISSRTLTSAAEAEALNERMRVESPKPPQMFFGPPANTGKKDSSPAKESNIISTAFADNVYLKSGKPVRIPPVKKPGEYKGLLLHFQAIAYNEYEPQVLAEFERRGWAVIDISTESSTQPPLSDEEIEAYKASVVKSNLILEEMFADKVLAFPESKAPPIDSPDIAAWIEKFSNYERSHPLYSEFLAATRATNKLRQGSFQACEGADLDEVARQIAIRADQAISGNCYAAETCLDYALTQRPDLQGIPVVMIGFSAGALTTPSAAAYLRDHLDAVVTIGGAANIFLVTQESSFTDGGVRVRCGKDKVPAKRIAELGELYLKHSKLDPFHTAPMIAHLPVLQVHASFDTWVPGELGDLLYERLGQPDRLTIGAGHELLFYFLPGKAKFIADWVEKATSHHVIPITQDATPGT